MYLVVLFMMVFSGAKVVVVYCFLVHFTLVADFILIQAPTPQVVSFVSIAQAITMEPLINGYLGGTRSFVHYKVSVTGNV